MFVIDGCATPLEEGSGQRVFSPNWDFVCTTKGVEGDGSKLFICPSSENKRPQLLWVSRKYMSILWSPDSRWLAVIDHYLAAQSAVLIFDVTQKGFPLVYQTPTDTKQETWEIDAWDCSKKKVKLKGSSRFSNEPYFETVTLSEKPTKQTLYDKGVNPLSIIIHKGVNPLSIIIHVFLIFKTGHPLAQRVNKGKRCRVPTPNLLGTGIAVGGFCGRMDGVSSPSFRSCDSISP